MRNKDLSSFMYLTNYIFINTLILTTHYKTFMLNQINDYTLLQILGHGTYGIVYLAESFKKEKFALKLIKINDKILKYAMTEAQTYVSLNHPNILKARQFFIYKQETYLVIVLEYCQDGDLSKLIGELDEQQCEEIMKKIAEGLVYIHSNNLTHRDIKPQNILMMNRVPKIADFGFTRSMTSSGASTKIGTPLYMAPEVQLEQKYDQDRKYSADVWSLGIVFFELLLGMRIYNLIEGDKIPCLRKDFPPEELINKIKSKKLRTLIRQMLEKDAEKRLSSKEVLQTLKNEQKKQEQKIQIIDERKKIQKQDLEQFQNLLLQNYRFVNLEQIWLVYGRITDEGVKALAANARNFPNLRKINLFDNKITDEGVKALAAAARNFPNLKEIRLSRNQIKCEGAQALAAAAGNFLDLQVINLGENRIKDEGMKALAAAAENFHKLTKIHLDANQIRDEGLKALAASARNLPNLRVINLSQNQISGEGAKALAAAAGSFLNLQVISLNYNNIRDEGVKSLAAAAGKFLNLKEIHLWNNKITDEGVKALANAAGNFPSLTIIQLDSNQITDEGVKALVAAAHLFKKLKQIGFEYNSTSGWELKNWLSKQKIPFKVNI